MADTKFKIIASHVENNLSQHERKVNDFCQNHRVVNVTNNFNSESYQSWFVCALSQVLVTTIEYIIDA